MQAHAGLQGQTRPTHYTVVFDQNNFDADAAQSVINHGSYIYARATKAVSLVPPGMSRHPLAWCHSLYFPIAYYADLLCERARHYLQDYLVAEGSVQGAEQDIFDRAVKDWGTGVHPNVSSIMFYI